MKHISFDESLVLREFARIAGEKGLVKSASAEDELVKEAGPAVNELRNIIMQSKRSQNPLAAATNAMNSFHAKYYGKIPNKRLAMLLTRARDAVGNFVLKVYRNSPEAKAAVDKFNFEVTKSFITPLTHQQLPELQLPQSAEDGVAMAALDVDVKTAKKDEGKKYDVTDETGEQLVEKAHPGGGTRTELTHSKTDENLVETIVEQQKRDIEVVNKMPKGTYAALLNLADKLDKMGYVRAADRVDSILKKKVAATPWQEAAQRERARILQKLQSVETDRQTEPMKQQMIKEFQGRSTPTLTETVNYAQELSNRWGRMFPEVGPLADYYARNFQDAVEWEQKDLREQFQQKQQPQTEEPQGVAKTEPTKPGGKRQRLNRLQNHLRRMVGLKPKQDAPFDRQLANVLRTKYPEAWKAVKNRAGFKAIFDAVKGQGRSKVEETAPDAPPAAPAAPGGKVNVEVLKEQLANNLYGQALRGLGRRGYKAEEIGDEVMNVIRKEIAGGAEMFDLSTKGGRESTIANIKRELNTAFPVRR